MIEHTQEKTERCEASGCSGGLSEINGQPLKVYSEISLERIQQEDKWGEQDHHPLEWLAILGEEVGEANKAALESHFTGPHNPGDLTWNDYRKELIQVAAVAVAMVECFDRKKSLDDRRCRICGCTDHDCSGCIEKTGVPCSWVEDDLCGACL